MIDPKKTTATICKWIQAKVEDAGATGVVVGLSGGVEQKESNAMKRFFAIMIFSLVFCRIAAGGEVPTGNTAPDSISMSWEQFMELWEESRDPISVRVQDFAYESAVYSGKAAIEKNNYHIRFNGLIRVTSFVDHNILVPVLSAELNPESMTIGDVDAGWIEKNGYYYVMIKDKGSHDISTRFTLTLEAQKWPRNFQLPLTPIPKTEINIHVADSDIEASFEPGVVMETVREETGDLIKGVAPAVENVAIRWLKQSEKREEIPLKMGAVSHTYVSLGENGANLKSEIDFQILQGESHYFQIRVPESIDILDVRSMDGKENISQWYTENSENSHTIHIYASYRQDKNFRVQLDCERTETQTNYQFSVPLIAPQGVERHENLVAVGSAANVEIAESAVQHSEARDVRFLPPEISRFSKDRALFFYKILDDDFNLKFDVRSHDKATVVKTRIERLEADSVVTEAGTVMTKATFYVQNNQAQFLRIRLLGEAKLLSAFTNGREIQPARDGDDFLIPLDKSTEDSFPVEIAWLSKTGRFGAFGSNSVLLSAGELSIGELAWRLYTPEHYQVLRFGGNVDLVPAGIDLFDLLGKVFDSDTHIAHAGLRGSKSYDYNAEGLKHRFKTGSEWEDSYNDQKISGSQIQVQIPVTGNFYRFRSYLIKGFTPQISFFYVNQPIHSIIKMTYGLATFLAVLWFLALCLERNGLHPNLQKQTSLISGAIVAALFIVLLLVLKLGTFRTIGDGMAYGFLAFALWQNRLQAKRYHARVSGRRYYLPEVLAILFLIPATLTLLGEFLPGVIFISISSIVFHIMIFRLHSYFAERKAKKATIATTSLIFSFLIIQGAPDLWAGSPVQQGLAGTSSVLLPGEVVNKEASVHLSWPKVETLLEKIEQKRRQRQIDPDIGHLFGTARITGDITEKYAALRIDVPLTLVSDKFIEIPLVSPSTPVVRAFYNKTPLALQRDENFISFEAGKENGREGILQLHLIAPVTEKGGVKEFEISSPLLQGGEVELRFGTDIKSVRLYNVSWEKRDGGTIKAALGGAKQLRGELATFIRKQETADETDKRVKKLYAATYTLVSLEDEIATFYSSIRYRILNEHVREFTIRLPADVTVHEIVGEDMEGWRKEKVDDDIAVYRISVMYPVANRYDLSVRYETAIPENEPFVVPSLKVSGVARDTGYIGVEMRGRGELSINKQIKARSMDIRELPAIIRADADAPFVYAFRYIEHPHNIEFNIRKHKEVRLDPAIADRIQYTRVISNHGKVLSQARMWIRNSRKQYATFLLPEGASIISTFLDGKSVKPSINEKGDLLLPLKRQSATPFVLDVVFEEPDVPIGSTGGWVRLGYPQVDIPASIVASDIYVPESMKSFEPKGDFRTTALINFVAWTSSALQENSLNMQQIGNNIPMLQNITQFDNNNNLIQTQGTMSLKIDLPLHGKKISTNAFYVPAGETLETDFFLIHHYIFNAGYAVAVLFFLAVGMFAKRFHQRILFPVLSLPLLVALYALFDFSWKAIILLVGVGYLLQYVFERWKKGQIPVPR